MDYIYYVIQAKKGDTSSYEYLVNNFLGMAISYSYSILQDFQLAEDAAQEAFILLFNNINKLKEPSAFPAWLKKLVLTCCHRILRKQKPETSLEIIHEISDSENNLNILSEKNEQKELVEKAMSQLNKGQREVFILYYTFDKSYAEIAAVLDITEAAVAGRMHQGKKKLKSILLRNMAEYLGGYQMDKNSFVRKIITGIVNPSQPETLQGDGYVACFSSLYIAVEEDQELDRAAVYNKFSTVAAIDFLTFDYEITTESRHIEPEDLAKEYGVDNYVKYTMGYAGYQYAILKRDEYDKDSLYKQLTASLDKDIPVLMETKYGWCVLTGYDERCFVYGYDGDKHRLSSETDEYWDELFVLHNWYGIMEKAVIFLGKQAPTITKKDIFSRIGRIIDQMEGKGYDDKLIKKLSDDEDFKLLTTDEQKVLFKQTLNWLYFHVHSRAMMCWGMDSAFYPDNTEEDRNLRQSINGYMGSSHDYCWCAFRTLGKGGFHVDDDDFSNFLDCEKRHKVADCIRFVSYNDHKTSCICKIIAGEYISDLERYLNEPKYNIPRDQVGPQEMGWFDTEIVTFPEARIEGVLIPINECNRDSGVFLVEAVIDQGMFYYGKNAVYGRYSTNKDEGSYRIAEGKYLKVTGQLPISIYNIVDSWYEMNGLKIASDKKIVIQKNKMGEFETYLPIADQ